MFLVHVEIFFPSMLLKVLWQRVLTLSIIDTGSWVILCCGRLSWALWDAEQLSDLSSLDVSVISPLVTIRNVSTHCQVFPPTHTRLPRGAKLLPNENHWFMVFG